jgi:hypothetical protein
VVTTTWHDVVREVVAGVAGEAEFRRALPPGFASHPDALAAQVDDMLGRLRKWLDDVDPHDVADDVVRRFWAGRPQLLAGQLHQILALDGIGDQSRLRRREGSVCHLVDAGDALTVILGTRQLHMPATLRPAMERIATSGPFPLEALADLMDGPSRRVLARRLVVEGLLEIVPVG